jgi:hypothetical protein
MTARKAKAPWARLLDGGKLMCVRCGAEYGPELPAPMDVFLAIMKAFTKSHRNCKPHADGDVCVLCSARHKGECGATLTPQQWIVSGDTGRSSVAIWSHMMHSRGNTEHPLDPDDFGRCYRLLKAIPAWRARIGEMASVSRVWGSLVEHWAELEALYVEELPTGRAPKLYARMKELGA